MTAAQQFREFGASVESAGDQVILQVGREMKAMTPHDAQRFAYYLARAYGEAGHVHMGAVNPVLERVPVAA